MKILRSIVAVAILVVGTVPTFLPSYASVVVNPAGPSENRIDYRAQKLFSLLVNTANLPFAAELVIVPAPFMQGAANGGCRAEVGGEIRNATIYLTTAAMQIEDVMIFILAHEVGHLQQRVLLPECSEITLDIISELDADVKAVVLLNVLGFDGATIARRALAEMCSQSGERWKVVCDGSGSHPSLEDRIRAVSAAIASW